MRFSIPSAFTLENSSIELETVYEWSGALTYNKGDLVSYYDATTTSSYYYLSNHDDNLNFPVSEYKHWTKVGPTNQWAMFSQYFDSVSEYEDSDLVIELQVGGEADTIVFTGVVASYIDVKVYASEGGALVFQNQLLVNEFVAAEFSVPLVGDQETFYNLYYTYFDQAYADCYIVITFANSPGFNTRCGKCFVGLSYYVGETQHKTKVGIEDYSKISINDFGVVETEIGTYSRTIEGDVYVEDSQLDEIIENVKPIAATPCFWDFNNEDTSYSSLVVYGFPRVVEARVGAPNATFINFEVLTAASRFENAFFYIRVTKLSANAVLSYLDATQISKMTGSLVGKIPYYY